MKDIRKLSVNLPKDLAEKAYPMEDCHLCESHDVYQADLDMKIGYQEMATINTALAELGMCLDLSSLEDYEGSIAEED